MVKEKMHLQEITIFDLGGQGHTKSCPVTYAPTKFEVTTSKGLGGDTFYKKFNIWPWGQGHEMLPSTLYIMWPIQLPSLKLLSCLFI